MKIEITPARAEQLLYIFKDWDEPFSSQDPVYQKAYTNCAKHIFDIFDITEKDLEEILK